jgi:DNA adenine methylase
MTNINPPIKYHGGKHYLAKRIIALMPKHTHYVEPYFGGGAVLLAKDPEGVSEVVNDINHDLSIFWNVLANDELLKEFQRQVDTLPFSEPIFDDCRNRLKSKWKGSAVDIAVQFFVVCRQSMAGRMKDFAPLSRNRTRRGMNEQASAWLTAIDGLPQVHARLKRVVILNKDALEVIRQQDGGKTLFYIDPPYLHETRATTGEYDYEMTEAQHEELLKTLATIKGKFLLSGYDSDLYASYAGRHGWTHHQFDLPNNAAGGRSKRRMIESVWCNYE